MYLNLSQVNFPQLAAGKPVFGIIMIGKARHNMGKRIEDVKKLSRKYNVRRLTGEDVDKIYALCAQNAIFYQYCPPFVTKEGILHDMKALPPRMACDDKYYIGYFEEDRLVAVMDLILGYPNEETAFMGLFMMEKSSQGKGIGSAIVEECFAFLGSIGYRFIRLGFAKENPQSEAFWVKNGFSRTGVEADEGSYIVVVMERGIISPEGL